MGLQEKFQTFFQENCSRPCTDSLLVRNALEVLISKHPTEVLDFTNEINISNCQEEDLFGKFQTIHAIKYIARKYGLPTGKFCQQLLQNFKARSFQKSSLRNKFQIAQCLKYSVVKATTFISIKECMDCIYCTLELAKSTNTEQMVENFTEFIHGICSQLVQCLLIQIENDSSGVGKINSKELLEIIAYLDPKTKESLLSAMKKWENGDIFKGASTSSSTVEDIEEGSLRLHHVLHTNGPEDQVMQLGESILTKSSTSAGKGQVVADAVKTQQIMTSNYKENISEKDEIQAISLSNALNTGRSKSTAKTIQSTITPGNKAKAGSDRGWFTTTGSDITILYNRSNAKQDIKSDDIDWLVGKTDFGFYISNATVTMYELSRITKIFQRISEYQQLKDDTIISLAHNFFSEALDSEYVNARCNLLHAFQNSTAKNGRVPEKLKCILIDFIKKSICTSKMKRMVWKILAQNDDNLLDAFPLALNDLESSKDEETQLQLLEYIGSQVVFEQKGKMLNEKFNFIEHLLKIVINDKFGTKIRKSTAEIIEDFLSFDNEFLTAEWQHKYLSLYSEYQELTEDDDDDDDDELTKLQIILIRSVLRNFEKVNGFSKLPENYEAPDSDTIQMLVDLCTQSEQNSSLSKSMKELEVLIVATFGNLVTSPTSSLKIPNVYKLAYKLLSKDTIDENGQIMLENEFKKEEIEEMNRNDTKLISISSIVAKILLSASLKAEEDVFPDSTIKFILEALTNEAATDKTTRILCSEILMNLSNGHCLPEYTLNILRYLISDQIIDIQIFTKAAYCCTAAKLAYKFVVHPEDLNIIAKVYVLDQVLVLGDKNYAPQINQAIINYLSNASDQLQFTEEVFQLLTFLLQGNIAVNHLIEMIKTNFNTFHCKIPSYTFSIIEDVLVSNPLQFINAIELLMSSVVAIGTILSSSTLETVHQNLIFGNEFTDERFLSFQLLLAANNNQELADYMFQDLDLEFLFLLLNFQLEYAKEKDDLNNEKMTAIITQTLQSTIEYQQQGRSLTILSFLVLNDLMEAQINTKDVIECLIQAAENKQSLSTEIMQTTFKIFGQEWENESIDLKLRILALASTLVHNNQILPDKFLFNLVNTFCNLTLKGCGIGELEEYDQMLFILAKIAQNNASKLPKVKNAILTIHFRNLYMNSSSNNRKIFGIANAFDFRLGKKEKIPAEIKAKELVRKFCLFWKKSKSVRHRLEILSALHGLSCLKDEDDSKDKEKGSPNKKLIHSTFLHAIQDQNMQIKSKGLDGFLSLNWNGASYCNEQDFYVLTSILCTTNNITDNIKQRIWKFLKENDENLPESLKNEINLFQQIENKGNDEKYLQIVKEIFNSSSEKFKLKQNFLQSEVLCQKLQSIIINNQRLCMDALKLIEELVEYLQYSKLFESIAIVMSTKLDCNEIQSVGFKIFKKLLKNPKLFTSFVTESMINHIARLPKNLISIRLVLKMLEIYESKKNVILSPELNTIKCTLELQLFLMQADYNPVSIDEITFDLDLIDHLSDKSQISLLAKYLTTEESNVDSTKHQILLIILFKSILNIQTGLPEELCNIAIRFTEQGILSMTAINLEYLTMYKYLIDHDYVEDLTKCLQVIAEAFPAQDSYAIKTKILECISLSICSDMYLIRKTYIPFTAVQILLTNLQSDIPKFREICLTALTNLTSSRIAFNSEEKEKESFESPVNSLKSMAINIYNEIFNEEQNEKIALKEFDKDPEFALELLKLLYSLKYWDFSCLRHVKDNRDLWRQNLITSDFLESFLQTETGKLQAAMIISQIFERFGFQSSSSEKIIQNVRDLINSSLQKLEENFVLQMLSIFLYLDSFEILSTFEKYENHDPTKILLELQTIAVKKGLYACGFALHKEIMYLYSKQLISLAGPEFVLLLVGGLNFDISRDISELDELLQALNKIKDKEVFKTKEFQDLIFATSEKLQDITTNLESYILYNLLPTAEPIIQKSNQRLKRLFKTILTTKNINMNQLEQFIILAMERSGGNYLRIYQIIDHLLSQSIQYSISMKCFEKFISSLKNSDKIWNRSDVIDIVNKIIQEFSLDSSESGQKSTEKFVQEFVALNKDIFETSEVTNEDIIHLCEVIYNIQQAKKKSEINKNNQDYIFAWKEEDIKNWADILHAKINSGQSIKDHDEEIFMVVKQAFLVITKHEMKPVQILTCMMSLNPQNKGVLLEVVTGSGKSAIIGILSAYHCLLNNLKVDVYTSSSVLAERDAKEWTPFFNLLGLTCDHNGDLTSNYISGLKSCYENNVVYGDCSQFQFDYLRHAYSDLNTRGTREFEKSLAIFDEVDATCIDDSSKLARLSSTLPGMDTMNLIYFAIWDRLCFIKTHLFQVFDTMFYLEGRIDTRHRPVTYSYIDSNNEQHEISDLIAYIINDDNLKEAKIHLVDDIERFVQDHLITYAAALITDKEFDEYPKETRAKITLPKHLQYFAESQIPKWINSALTAVTFQENVHYVVADGKIKPVDFRTTGIVHSSTNWNNGLHPFLQIKHNLRIDSESVTTNFLSNIAIFQKYGPTTVGLTGTLGSDAGKNCLKSVYNVELIILPEMYHKRFIRYPDYIATNLSDWIEEIVRTTIQEVNKRRAVLIICETIKHADTIANVLDKLKDQQQKINVKMYTKNQENQEKQIQRAHPGDVIVATNLAGRGTDIKTNDIEIFGGLHVLLTFLPSSLRVEGQAFGRTSRQGNKGTGQLIICKDENNTASVESRNLQEEKTLEEFQNDRLPLINLKDQLFAQFVQVFQEIRLISRSQNPGKIEKFQRFVGCHPAPSFHEVITLSAVEERWAMFLKQIDDGNIEIQDAQTKFNKFVNELNTKDEASIVASGQNPFYLIQLGNYEFQQDSKLSHSLEKAKIYFEKAIQINEEFATGAYIGIAYCLLKGQVNLVMFDNHSTGYKESALDYLQKGRKLLYDEMATLTVTQAFIRKNAPNAELYEPIGQQVTSKLNLLGSYLKNVEQTIQVIEKSLRRVYCSGLKGNVEEIRMIPDSIIQETKSIPFKENGYEKYHLSFYDLTVFEDSGITKDQIINTMALESWTDAAKKKMDKMRKQVMKRLLKPKEDDIDKDAEFSRCLTCTEVNMAEFIKSVKEFEPFLEKLWINVEKLHVEYEFDILDGKCSSFCTQFHEFNGEIFSDKKCQLILKKYLIKQVVITLHKNTEGHRHEPTTIETLNTSQFESRLNCWAKNKKLTITFDKIKSIKDVTSIVKLISTKGNLQTFNFTMKKFAKVKILEKLWTENLQTLSNCTFTINFDSLSKDDSKSIIPILRKQNYNIILHCKNLNEETAQLVLGNADITQEHILLNDCKELAGLYMSDNLPIVELHDLNARGLTLIVTFNERKFVPWISIAGMVGLASVQAIAGGFLICTGFGATVGMGLITEGMADLVQAQRIYATREFSWSSYAVQKSISLVISAVSMGLSSLKDGAKGAAIVIEGAGKEIVEQAGTRVVVNKVTLNVTIKSTKSNLQSIAIKKISTSVVETGAKIVLKEVFKGLSDFCFEQARSGIIEKVGNDFQTHFRSKSKDNINFYRVLDKNQFKMKVESIVMATMNPKATGWVQLWDSVGTPLINGILSSPQFLGSAYTRITMIYGFISGMKQITEAVDKVCTEIDKKLREQQPTLKQILQNYCHLPAGTNNLDEILGQITFNKGEEFSLNFELDEKSVTNIDKEHRNSIEQFFNTCNKSYKEFKFDDNFELSELMKSVVGKIASHIIRIADSHLVSPVLTVAAGSIVAKLSAEIQDKFLVDSNQNTDEQNEQGSSGKNTFAKQINYNAKAYMIAWTNRQNVASAMQVKLDKDQHHQQQKNVNLNKVAEDAINGKPTDMAGMFAMAAANDVKIKIVTDPDYQPSQEDLKNGINIVLFEKGVNGQPGHFSLMNGTSTSIQKGDMDCGYLVISQLTGKSVDELRSEMPELVQNNPKEFSEIQANTNWMNDRYPQQASQFLMVGGARRAPPTIPNDLKEAVRKSLGNPYLYTKEQRKQIARQLIEANADFLDGPTPKDVKGYIYILRAENDDVRHRYKIGKADDIFWRRDGLERNNPGDEYEIVAEISTSYRHSAETFVHRVLDSVGARDMRDVSDGGTEYFRGNVAFLETLVADAVETVQNHNAHIVPPTHDNVRPLTSEELYNAGLQFEQGKDVDPLAWIGKHRNL